MKKIWLLFGFMLFALTACSSQKTINSKELSRLIDTGEFTFMARRAAPSDMTAVNVLNSLPGGSSTRVLDLSYGYNFKVTPTQLTAELPFFGRLYIPTMDRDRESYRFTSKDFTLDRKSTGKKVSYVIRPRDVAHLQTIYLDVFPNGQAYLSLSGDDRSPITYDGEIVANPPAKP